jgi:hypothetical protein
MAERRWQALDKDRAGTSNRMEKPLSRERSNI